MNKHQAELYHHGIKGMHWGIRRYQNPDGSLTAAGKKRYDKKLSKEISSYRKTAEKRATDLYIQSYNKTADEYNGGKIDAYNKAHKVSDPDYFDGYQEQFSKDFKKNYNEIVSEFTRSNKNYQRAVEIAEKYGSYKVDELAKQNRSFINEMSIMFGFYADFS